ncbi:ABC transporter permease [Paraburkholderia silvatlantica]|uniref:Peptide/nickel transport system permease protein n=1 Tax=Paraburkholderia silvatlantica TaxID=321895 RepID=A0ABR6FHT1_9BURK|nr:ABC transporter permease [Paraburkholderia silvatlantica]MBB2926638.1 peptide/nickel transport system permease protein [Paraburkholderia silvatlantica]PVY37728.1 peptide/nickel transport system permease protein [Paraburkholderia silvatlantica]PXW42691.1 peptide/nickel transport system permease protein [Paraburkholderia silvatlantica]
MSDLTLTRAGTRIWRRIAQSPGLSAGVVLLVAICVLAAGAPYFTHNDPLDMVGTPFTWPGTDPSFLLGTDMMGRDMFSGIAFGARVSLEIGVAAGLLATLAGWLVGAAAGFYGGLVDDLTMRVADLFQTMPALLFTIVLVVVVHPSVTTIVVGVALTNWPQVARLVRADALRVSRAEYVQAATVIGMSRPRIVITHVLPNVATTAIVMLSILAGNAILTEAVLSFLGLGDPNVVTWGSMIGSGREALQTAWYMTALPGCAVLVTVLSLNLIGNGLNDLVNPRRRGAL